MNNSNQAGGLHRLSLIGLNVYMKLNRILTTKEILTIKNTSYTVQACVCVCLLQSCYNLQKIRLCDWSSPLDESFKVNFQVKLANESRL